MTLPKRLQSKFVFQNTFSSHSQLEIVYLNTTKTQFYIVCGFGTCLQISQNLILFSFHVERFTNFKDINFAQDSYNFLSKEIFLYFKSSYCTSIFNIFKIKC